jgi:hypothetical protein
MDTQVDLVLALSGLYNFIRQHEDIDHELANIELEVEEKAVQEMPIDIKSAGNTYMNKRREEIAQQMWKDYQQYLLDNKK